MKLGMGCAKAIFDRRIPMTPARNMLFEASEISGGAQWRRFGCDLTIGWRVGENGVSFGDGCAAKYIGEPQYSDQPRPSLGSEHDITQSGSLAKLSRRGDGPGPVRQCAGIDVEHDQPQRVDHARNDERADQVEQDPGPGHLRDADSVAAENDGVRRRGDRHHERA